MVMQFYANFVFRNIIQRFGKIFKFSYENLTDLKLSKKLSNLVKKLKIILFKNICILSIIKIYANFDLEKLNSDKNLRLEWKF